MAYPVATETMGDATLSGECINNVSCHLAPAEFRTPLKFITHSIPMPMPMRYIVPSLAIILVACFFPTHPMAMVAYIAISLYSIFLIAGLFRKAPPEMKRHALIAASCAVLMALGIGAFFYFR